MSSASASSWIRYSEVAAMPIFFSSDYVFSEKTPPLRESDPREPSTCYGHQKLTIEKYIEDHFEDFLIFRTSKLMSKTAHAKNILFPVIHDLKFQKKIRCFKDQWINPVFVEDIAKVIQVAEAKGLKGHFHLGTRRVFSRVELAKFLATSLGLNPDLIESIPMSEIRFSEKRPNYNVLDCRKFEAAAEFRFSEIEDEIASLQGLL